MCLYYCKISVLLTIDVATGNLYCIKIAREVYFGNRFSAITFKRLCRYLNELLHLLTISEHLIIIIKENKNNI